MGHFRECELSAEIPDREQTQGTSPATGREGKENKRYTYLLLLVVDGKNHSKRESLLQLKKTAWAVENIFLHV